MHSLSRWWDRNRTIVVLGGVAVVSVGVLKALNLLPVRELYGFLSQPFQVKPAEIAVQVADQTQALQARIQALEAKNKILEQQLKQPQAKTSERLTALVIGRGVDQWWQQVMLNQGARQGVKQDSVIEAGGALVGRVTAVTPNTSQVLLISDPQSRFAVMLSRSRSVGILHGDRQNHGILEFFDQDPNVQVGDLVTTSPLSCRFPPDIPVGVVKSLDRTKPTAIAAQVEFTVPLDRLEWVQVYQYEKEKKKSSDSTSTCP